jgi:hypothetical protein
MALIVAERRFAPMSGFSAGLRLRLVKRPSAEYHLYASTKTLVRPCSSKKLLIYELETYAVPNTCHVIYGWALTNGNSGEISDEGNKYIVGRDFSNRIGSKKSIDGAVLDYKTQYFM